MLNSCVSLCIVCAVEMVIFSVLNYISAFYPSNLNCTFIQIWSTCRLSVTYDKDGSQNIDVVLVSGGPTIGPKGPVDPPRLWRVLQKFVGVLSFSWWLLHFYDYIFQLTWVNRSHRLCLFISISYKVDYRNTNLCMS